MTLLILRSNIKSLSVADATALRDLIAAAHGCHILPAPNSPTYDAAIEADGDMCPEFRGSAEAGAFDEMLAAGCIRLSPEQAEARAVEGAPRALQQLAGKSAGEVSDWLRDGISREGWGDIPACFDWARAHAKTSTTAALLLARCDHHGLTARLAGVC